MVLRSKNIPLKKKLAKTEKLKKCILLKKFCWNFFSFPFFRLTSSFPFQVIDGAKTFLFYFSINHFNSFQIRSEINHFKSKLTGRHNFKQISVYPMNFQKKRKKIFFERFTKKKRQIRSDVRSTKLNNILGLKTVKCSMFQWPWLEIDHIVYVLN